MTDLVWEEVDPWGAMSVPGRSRWHLPELMNEVGEYFDCGATVGCGDVVFDVGANVGAFAIQAAHRCDGALSLYCFEPVPAIFGALSANAARNPRLAEAATSLFEVALVSEGEPSETEMSFFRRLPTDSTCDIADKRLDFEMFFAEKGRLFRERLAPSVGSTVAGAAGRFVAAIPQNAFSRALFDAAIGHVRLSAATTTLSAVVQERDVREIDLLKIDVEGSELRVLQGICPDHWPRIRQVVLEGHDHGGRLEEIRRLMVDHGMTVERVSRPDGSEERGLDSFLLYARRPNGHR